MKWSKYLENALDVKYPFSVYIAAVPVGALFNKNLVSLIIYS